MSLNEIIAPVINGIPNPNEVRVVDCLAYSLSTITAANGYFVDGMLIDRRRDPRLAQQNKPQEYRAKNAMARIKLMNSTREAKGSIGGGAQGYIRTGQQIVITTCQTMTTPLDNLGITADQLKGWMRHDIFRMLNKDFQMGAASAAILAEKTDWGRPPSVIDLKCVKVVAAPIQEEKFPDVYQAFFIQFSFDEYGQNLDSGRGA